MTHSPEAPQTPPDSPPVARPHSLNAWAPMILLIAIVFLAFWPVLRADFVNWDDTDMIVRNQHLQSPTPRDVMHFWREPHLGLYIPLTYTAYAGLALLSDTSGGAADGSPLNPRLFHAASLLLHAAAAVFVWLILIRLRLPRWSAWIGAAIFAVHPVQTEAVAWAASLNTVLSGALALAAVWCYVEHATRAERRKRIAWFAAATVLCLLALLAKPSAVVVPLLTVAIDLLVLRRRMRAWIAGAAMWLVLAGVFALIAQSVQPASSVTPPPPLKRPLVAADAIAFYFGKIILPRGLAIDYGRTPQEVLPRSASLLGRVIVVIVLISVAWALRRREPLVAAGAAIFMLALLPVLGLVPFEFQRISTVADRYVYLAMPGIALIAARLAALSRPAAILIAVLIVILIVTTMRQATYWHDTYSLANRALAVNPDSVAAHKVLAATYAADRQPVDAERHYRAALALTDDDAEVRFNYGNLLLRRGDYHAAIEHYDHARAAWPKDVRILKNLGVALARAGKARAAEEVFLQALALTPNDVELQQNLRALRKLLPATTSSTHRTTQPHE